jgi:hypothetical protein
LSLSFSSSHCSSSSTLPSPQNGPDPVVSVSPVVPVVSVSPVVVVSVVLDVPSVVEVLVVVGSVVDVPSSHWQAPSSVPPMQVRVPSLPSGHVQGTGTPGVHTPPTLSSLVVPFSESLPPPSSPQARSPRLIEANKANRFMPPMVKHAAMAVNPQNGVASALAGLLENRPTGWT